MPRLKFGKIPIRIAHGRSNLGRVKNITISWEDLFKKFQNPVVTKETIKKYLKLPKEQQDKLKNVDGYWIGAPCSGGRRATANVQERDVVTFDCDKMSPGLLSKMLLGLVPGCDYEFQLHTTRKHVPDAPRVRLAVLCLEPIPRLAYNAAARVLASKFDRTMEAVDDVSFRVAQMMFKPSCSRNSEYIAHHNPGERLDWRRMLDDWADEHGDWKDFRNLPYAASQGQHRPGAEAAEDPTTKRGLIGAFCRAFDVEEAMEAFLPEVYEPGDPHSGDPRYTYTDGSTSNGAVVYGDGNFLYSHHSTDPVSERLVNSFDLVRLHKFGKLDEGKDTSEGRDPTALPSYKAMVEFAHGQAPVKKELLKHEYDTEAMFDDISDEDDVAQNPAPEKEINGHRSIDDILGPPIAKKTPEPDIPYETPDDWIEQLEVTTAGAIKQTVTNTAVVLRHDFRLRGAIWRNNFNKEIVCRRTIRTKLDVAHMPRVQDPQNGDRWSDAYDVGLRVLLESPNGAGLPGYGLKVPERDLRDAVAAVANKNPFHPVLDQLTAPEWDGVPRLETALIDHLGAPDNAYTRAIFRLHMIAAVTRLYEPGHKYDFAIILEGPQGLGKSTWIMNLAFGKYFGELQCDIRDRQTVVEIMTGKLFVELPEMASFRKAESDEMKGFMSRTIDEVRLAYERRKAEFPRQCVFWGSTNERAYLKDPTGNRRWLPCPVGVTTIDQQAIIAVRDQLWAEALHEYRLWRKRVPREAGFLDLSLQGEALQIGIEIQENARLETPEEGIASEIEHWLDTPVPISEILGTADEDFDDENEPLGIRVRTCVKQVVAERYPTENARYNTNHAVAMNFGKSMGYVRGWAKLPNRVVIGSYGQQRAYQRVDATSKELWQGYRLVSKRKPEDIL